METNNVLVIPGADFSNAAVENIFSLCNNDFLGEALLSGSNSDFDWSRIFVITKGNNYQGNPIAKLTFASTGSKLVGSVDKVSVYKVKPKSGNEGAYVIDNNCAQLLFTLDFETKSNELIEIFLPRSITLENGEYIGVQVGTREKSTNLQYRTSSGLFAIPQNGEEATLTSEIDIKQCNSIGIYSIE